ncbi:hypothetical protein QBC38DRAFT_447560 [Podospora fimiseda]|uniref:Uncharacterized protein n=1 Tax=Podospora fimiseda TaxID=252190 RepID=A0AAN7BH90_9PEZI|nr:hypothetical protein QBC38DRAFT_447560 [Podospora fimiseda]
MRTPTWNRRPSGTSDMVAVTAGLTSVEVTLSGGASEGITRPPVFTCSIYTPGKTSIKIYVDDGVPLPQDLIFSVLVSGTENSDWRLVELDIIVPLGPADPDSHKLMVRYNESGPRMLSNLRFNVVASLKHDEDDESTKFLVLRLLPRSEKGWIDVKKIGGDISFLLCLADVNLFDRGTAFVKLGTAAYYTYRYDQAPREGDFTVRIDR